MATTSEIATGWLRVSSQLGGDHHREVLDQSAQHQKRRAAGPDDHGGADVDELRHRRGQHLGDLEAAAQMLGAVVARALQAAEVDGARHAGAGHRVAEGARGAPVAGGEVLLGAGPPIECTR